MKPKILKNEKEYHDTIRYIDTLFRNNSSKDISSEILMLSVLIGDYESRIMNPNIDLKSIDHIYHIVSKISPLEEKSDICKRGLKLNEEVGELSAEILKLDGYKYTTDSKEEIRKNLLSEAADSLIQLFDIFIGLEYSKEEISAACEEKINKWLSQINKK